jgi:hypothetical protein
VPLASRYQDPGRAVVIVALAALGLDVSVDRIRDPLVRTTCLTLEPSKLVMQVSA